MSTSGASPSRSPRLPSPPPFTEVQIGPKSPTVSDGLHPESEDLLGVSQGQDDASERRIRPGTRSVDMASGPPLIPLSQLDSPFQLQEHLKATYHNFTRPPGSNSQVAITHDIARKLAEPPEGVERSLWLYELCRFLTMKANNLVIAFFAEDPPCSAQTCPEMRASEWQYLCAVHDPPKACCAIDYCCHTLDWATNVLTSPKYFPSRLTLGTDAAGGPQASMRHLTNIFRRVYRIFAHAWFQHREIFWQVEGHDGLYVFFKTVCDVFHLIPEDNYTVPPEAEGQESAHDDKEGDFEGPSRRVTILRKDSVIPIEAPPSIEEPDSTGLTTAATTRRHRHTPSTGMSVTTIAEAAEDDDLRKENKEDTSVGNGTIVSSEVTETNISSNSEDVPISMSIEDQPTHPPEVNPESGVDTATATEESAESDKEKQIEAVDTAETTTAVQDKDDPKDQASEPVQPEQEKTDGPSSPTKENDDNDDNADIDSPRQPTSDKTIDSNPPEPSDESTKEPATESS